MWEEGYRENGFSEPEERNEAKKGKTKRRLP